MNPDILREQAQEAAVDHREPEPASGPGGRTGLFDRRRGAVSERAGGGTAPSQDFVIPNPPKVPRSGFHG